MSSLSISSSSSSNSSSIYSDRTVISGLASGLDTETLIEEAVSGYETKITNLQAEVTKYEWKQEAYRDIITPLVSFSNNYTSYTSGTNLASTTFFNNATIVESLGDNASKISATGKSSSDVSITGVSQLATAARYSGVGSGLTDKLATNLTGDGFDIGGNITSGKLSGNLTLSYDSTNIYLSFSTDDVYSSAQELADAINEKLSNKSITFNDGDTGTASDYIKAVVDGDTISFERGESAGSSSSVYIYSASSAIKTALGINPAGSSSDTSLTSFTFDPDTAVKTVSTVDYLNQKGFTITLDGTSKTVKGPTQAELIQKAEKEGRDTWNTNDYIDLLQEKIDAAFGSGKISVTNALAEDEETAESNMKFQFEVLGDTASTLLVKSSAGEAVGISGSLSNYVDTSSKLGDLLDLDDYDAKLDEYGRADTDSNGNTIYTVTINGVDFDVTKDTTLSSLMSKINSSDEANVSVSYSKTTQKFSIAASETGASGKVSIDSDLAEAIFGKIRTEDEEDEDGNLLKANMTEGQDAKLTAIVNGETVNLTRSSNSVSIDGLSLTLKGTFEATNDDEIVTFSTSVDTEKIVSAVKSMISDYNAIVTAVKSAYTTYPAQKSDGSSYEPLSEDDKADMSDTAIENYEAKAKQGLLFMDSDLSSLYSALTNCFSSSSLKSIGITSSYSDGLTTISLDESTFTQALQDDPDKVRDLFAGSDSSDGLMTKLSTVCSKYARTTGATKGILIEKAGSSLASSTLTTNTWYKAITSLEEQITKWQDRLSDKVDYYTTQFTNLETLISEMNSQSSMLSGLSGGY